MNKRKTITIVIIIWIIVALLVGVVALSSKSKPSISATEFATKMKQNGYAITNASEQFAQYDYVKNVYIAGNENISYQIEFYELSNDTFAESFFEKNKAIFQSQKESASAETNLNGKNYSKYTLSTGNKYRAISRIDNTVVYLEVDSSYKNEVQNILNELGY